jgi:hypothetical protein
MAQFNCLNADSARKPTHVTLIITFTNRTRDEKTCCSVLACLGGPDTPVRYKMRSCPLVLVGCWAIAGRASGLTVALPSFVLWFHRGLFSTTSFRTAFLPGKVSRNIAMHFLRKIGSYLAPSALKLEDGRDQWPSRAAFLLAAMGGCAGQGNLLRYPSVKTNYLKL